MKYKSKYSRQNFIYFSWSYSLYYNIIITIIILNKKIYIRVWGSHKKNKNSHRIRIRNDIMSSHFYFTVFIWSVFTSKAHCLNLSSILSRRLYNSVIIDSKIKSHEKRSIDSNRNYLMPELITTVINFIQKNIYILSDHCGRQAAGK